MRFFLTPIAIAAITIVTPVAAQESAGPGYEDSIRCAALNTAFSGTEEDPDSDEAQQYERSGAAFLAHAILTGGKDEDSVQADFDEALEELVATMNDETTPEDFLSPHATTCAELEVENADLFSTYED